MSADPLRNAIMDLEAQLSKCRAERKQAIDERDAAEQNLSVIAAFLNCREGLEVEAVKQMQARCEQAIDALRTLAYPKDWPEDEHRLTPAHSCVEPIVTFCRAALLSLGEQP